MKRSDLKPTVRKNRLIHRCIALLTVLSVAAALTLPDYAILPVINAENDDTVMPLAAPEDNNDDDLLLSFNFNDSTDGLTDQSENGVTATLMDVDNIIGTADDGNGYLDLTNSDAYLSVDGSILKGLTEITVEMDVLTKDTNTNWAFFAAQDGTPPTAGNESYLGILLNGNVTVERFAGGRPTVQPTAEWDTNKWQTIRVEFKTDSTYLYIENEEPKFVEGGERSLTDCLGESGALWFGHAPWATVNPYGEGFNGYIDNIRIWDSDEPDDSKLIAEFNFDDENDRLKDSSGSNTATIEGGGITDVSDLFGTDEDGTSYIDLSGKDTYLSLTNADGSGVLNGLKELTLEMRVKTDDTSGPNWAFFAAPNDTPQRWQSERYLGVLLKDNNVTVERYANSGERPFNIPGTGWNDNDWHIIRVVFKISSTILCVDGNAVELGTLYSLDKCVGEDGVLWLGHASWEGGQGLNGCIDYIKIWDHAIYEPIDEEQFIVADSASEPRDTKVNMFDYWITDQYANDYRTLERTADLDNLLKGINEEHLFLFVGDTVFTDSPSSPSFKQVGIWNRNRGFEGGDDSGYHYKDENGIEKILGNTITQGIVQNTLENGYPKLALDKFVSGDSPFTVQKLNDLWKTNGKTTESLDYLFDPTVSNNYKASYTDVKGLFRMDNEGYYKFHSWETFAELNVDQPSNDKTSTSDNRITLYDKIWGWGMPWDDHEGQFFPFNDWSNLFFVKETTAGGEQILEQAHKNDIVDYKTNASGQTTTDEPLNHYFGMTVETVFLQPADGKLDLGGGKTNPMEFVFSGDDDVWIFIDDVLVGDLGGIHGYKDISIDFSTGKIEIQPGELDAYSTTLAEMFEEVDNDSTKNWNVITDQQTGDIYKIFPNNSTHTLKFFYLERGNQFSNCNIRFNLQSVQPDVILKTDENGEPLPDAEFELYAATVKSDVTAPYAAADFVVKDGIVAAVTTNSDGMVELRDTVGNPIILSDDYYILRETKAPEGYRPNKDIILKYNSNTGTFTVVNKYETGAYASFSAYFDQRAGEIHTAEFDPDNGTQNKLNDTVDTLSNFDLEKGLAFIVPVKKVEVKDDSGNITAKWLPLYGTNKDGWNTVGDPTKNYTEEEYNRLLLEAAIDQAYLDEGPDFHMTYDSYRGALSAGLEDVPGNAAQYVSTGGAELSQATLFVDLSALRLNGSGSDELFETLKKNYTAQGALNALSNADLTLLYTDSFEKTYRTVIHVVDMPQKLIVRKIDIDGKPLENVLFTLSDGSSYITDSNGEFTVTGLSEGTYILTETAPEGYLTSKPIEVIVDEKGNIYANADNDNVRVYAEVGELAPILERFTKEGDVVRDFNLGEIEIIETAYTKDKSDGDWEPASSSTNIAEKGFITVKPMTESGIDMSSMYSLYNIVEVTNVRDKSPVKTELSPGDRKTVKPGDEITYEITWSNESAAAATLTFTDPLDRNVEFVSAGYDNVVLTLNEDGTFTGGTGDNVTITCKYDKESEKDVVTWKIMNVPSGKGVTVTLKVRVKDITENVYIINKAAVTNSNIKDPEGDPISYDTDKVENPAEPETLEAYLTIRKEQALNGGERTQKPLDVNAGDKVTYYLTVTIGGDSGAVLDGIVVQDKVPEGLILVEDSIGCSKTTADNKLNTKVIDGSFSVEDGIIEWVIESGEVYDEFTLIYTVIIPEVKESTTWTNIAYAASGVTEDNPAPPYPGTEEPDSDDTPEGGDPSPDPGDDEPDDDEPDTKPSWKPSNEVEIKETVTPNIPPNPGNPYPGNREEPAVSEEPEQTEQTTQTEAMTTEPPVTEPSETAAPTPDDNNFNLDDDGFPRGDESLTTEDDNFNLDDDGLPRGDQNLPTGAPLGGNAYMAVGALILSAAALAVRKRKYNKKDK